MFAFILDYRYFELWYMFNTTSAAQIAKSLKTQHIAFIHQNYLN